MLDRRLSEKDGTKNDSDAHKITASRRYEMKGPAEGEH
jgi:hypothetical protein